MPIQNWLGKIISALKAYKAAIIWAAFVLFISLLPGKKLPKLDFWDLNIGDKLAHVGVFFVLGVLLIYGSYRRTKFERPNWVYLFVFPLLALVYGIVIEIFQGWFTVSRHASLGDVLADAIGAVLGTILAFSFFKPRS